MTSAIPNALAAQHAAAFDGRAGLVLDRELAQALVAVWLVADLRLGGDAGRLVGRRADRGRLEDAGLLGARAEGAAMLGEVIRCRIEQALQDRLAALHADALGSGRHRLNPFQGGLVGDLPQTCLNGCLPESRAGDQRGRNRCGNDRTLHRLGPLLLSGERRSISFCAVAVRSKSDGYCWRCGAGAGVAGAGWAGARGCSTVTLTLRSGARATLLCRPGAPNMK